MRAAEIFSITSLSLLSVLSLPPSRAHEGACAVEKRERENCNDFDLPDIHKQTIHLALTLLIDKINNDY